MKNLHQMNKDHISLPMHKNLYNATSRKLHRLIFLGLDSSYSESRIFICSVTKSVLRTGELLSALVDRQASSTG